MQEKIDEILKELEGLSKERTKKRYMKLGASEPLFGVNTGDMKGLYKKNKNEYELALALYNTGNFDAMYLAGMITDPEKMTEEDFENWISKATWSGVSDWIVAITLSESPLGQKIADKWIHSSEDLKKSAGYYSYFAMLGHLKDENFDKDKLVSMLDDCLVRIAKETERTKISMSEFITAVAVSYLPLHEYASQIAKEIGEVAVNDKESVNPYSTIQKAVEKNRIGFKRAYVRC